MDELIVLRPGYVLADPPKPALAGHSVVVRGERIEAVMASGDTPADAKVLEFPGATLMPGLIDAHVHLTLCGCCAPRQTMMQENNDILLLRAGENARLALRAGITTLRDCGDRGAVTFTLREAISRGVLPGPRLLVSGPPLTSPRGHCYFMGGEVDGRDRVDPRARCREDGPRSLVACSQRRGDRMKRLPPELAQSHPWAADRAAS